MLLETILATVVLDVRPTTALSGSVIILQLEKVHLQQNIRARRKKAIGT